MVLKSKKKTKKTPKQIQTKQNKTKKTKFTQYMDGAAGFLAQVSLTPNPFSSAHPPSAFPHLHAGITTAVVNFYIVI